MNIDRKFDHLDYFRIRAVVNSKGQFNIYPAFADLGHDCGMLWLDEEEYILKGNKWFYSLQNKPLATKDEINLYKKYEKLNNL